VHDYWKKVCEDEQRSRQRNEQLIREFDKLEMKARELEDKIAELSAAQVCVIRFVFVIVLWLIV